jgi:hypothetical protein
MSAIKIIVSGNIIEVYEYEKVEVNDIKDKKDSDLKWDRKKENIEQATHRARENIRRSVLSNFTDRDLFITLTFADDVKDNIDYTNREFKKFIQRVNYKTKKVGIGFKYIAVWELTKKGRIHYHMICNLPLDFIEGDLLEGEEKYHNKENSFREMYWKNGWVDIQEIKGCDNVGAYLIKYLQKDFVSNHKENKKRYLHSVNLDKPHVISNDDIKDTLEILKDYYPVFTSNYELYYQGNVKYKEYNLLREVENCI